eukprot:6206583-Pleurochrysis_carterae.AAC.1
MSSIFGYEGRSIMLLCTARHIKVVFNDILRRKGPWPCHGARSSSTICFSFAIGRKIAVEQKHLILSNQLVILRDIKLNYERRPAKIYTKEQLEQSQDTGSRDQEVASRRCALPCCRFTMIRIPSFAHCGSLCRYGGFVYEYAEIEASSYGNVIRILLRRAHASV